MKATGMMRLSLFHTPACKHKFGTRMESGTLNKLTNFDRYGGCGVDGRSVDITEVGESRILQ